MKRKLLVNLLSAIAILFFWQAGFAQNLLSNGNMESWTGTTLSGWTTVQGISQETTIVHGGMYSAKQIGGTKKLGQTINVTPGDTLDISIWYYVASGDGTDARIWSYWKDAGGTNISANAAELRGPNSSYLPSDASWQNYTATVVAPSNAAKLYFEVRTYKGATVYWDDLSVIKSTAGGGGSVTAPSWIKGYPRAIHVEDTRLTLLINMDDAGKAYYIVVPSGATAPTSAEVKAGANYDTVTVYQAGTVDVASANNTVMENIEGAQPNTSADIWVVAEDNAGNLQSTPVKISITTTGSRSLSFNKPLPNASFVLGDTITVEWTSANIDSLLIGTYPASGGLSAAFVTGGPVAAADGSYKMVIPQDAHAGDFGLVLWDLYDTSYKQTVSPITVTDNRELHLTSPTAGDSIYPGDSVVFRWTSAHVDSIYIGVKSKDAPRDSVFIITITPGSDFDHPIPQAVSASKGYYGFRIPNDANADTLTIYLFDASSNMSFYDSVQPVYLIDTTPPHIKNLTPPPGDQVFPVTGGLSVQFDSEIVPGTGQVHVKKVDGTTVADIPVSKLHFWGMGMGKGNYGDGFSIWPDELNLVSGQSYYIEMDSALVKDTQGRPFAGLKGNYWNFTVASSNLYFSEYIEGSSNNKALEVYNPTNHAINLNNYMIASASNGGDFATDSADLYYFPHGAVLKPGAVFVLANSGASSDILKVTNDTLAWNEGGYVVSFNGNDARLLVQRVGENGMAWIDQIGNNNDKVSAGWDVAGIAAATKDHTLLRKASVKMGTLDWGYSAGSNADNSQWIVEPKNYFDNIGLPTPTGHDQAEITGFRLFNLSHDNVTMTTNIDANKDTVYVKVLSGTDVTKLVTDIKVSMGAVVKPKSGDTLDFTQPQNFTVTSENQVNSQVWVVKVSVAPSASDQAYIASFELPNSVGDAMIDSSNYTVNVLMPYGTDLTSLTPEIIVSAGATINPVSGVAQDFTNPVVYKVTAQDGTTTIDWTVMVNIERTHYVPIHDIQYTTDASGDSPYKGQMVRTSGVVTALNVYKGARKGYFIEDKETAWDGIYVYDPDTANHVAVGDSVEVAGMVDEYYNFTEIKGLKYFKNLGSGYVRMPVDLSTGLYSEEQWEAVLVKFTNATCTNASLGKGEVEVDDGSGAGVIDDYLFQYDPFILNDVYTVTGVVNYWYGKFTLNPRNADDISNVTGISNSSLAENISIYPNPGNGLLHIGLNNAFKGDVTISVMDITGRLVYRHVFKNVMSRKLLVDISNVASNLYFISISDAHNMVVKKFMKR